MKTTACRVKKAHAADNEAQVRKGKELEMINRGRLTVRIVPVRPRSILKWDDHLATAAPGRGRSAQATVRADRDGRW